jgi:hypothetical protein
MKCPKDAMEHKPIKLGDGLIGCPGCGAVFDEETLEQVESHDAILELLGQPRAAVQYQTQDGEQVTYFEYGDYAGKLTVVRRGETR